MNAITALAVTIDPGDTVHEMAEASWHNPHAATPTKTITRRSMYRTKKRLLMTPMRPMHVIITEYENG